MIIEVEKFPLLPSVSWKTRIPPGVSIWELEGQCSVFSNATCEDLNSDVWRQRRQISHQGKGQKIHTSFTFLFHPDCLWIVWGVSQLPITVTDIWDKFRRKKGLFWLVIFFLKTFNTLLMPVVLGPASKNASWSESMKGKADHFTAVEARESLDWDLNIPSTNNLPNFFL